MYRNPKYLEKSFHSLLTDEKKNNKLWIKSILNMSTEQLRTLSPRDFIWYSSDDWVELQSRLSDFKISQLNEMITPQKLKQIPVERLLQIQQELLNRDQELMDDGTMTIVRPLTKLGQLLWAEVEVNVLQLFREAIQCSEKWHLQKNKNHRRSEQPIMADEYHVFVDALMARWKLDRKTVDKYFQIQRLLGYNVIALQEVLDFSKKSLRAQAVFSAITCKPIVSTDAEEGFIRQNENLFFDRIENQDNGIETIGDDLIENMFDIQDMMEEIRQDEQLMNLCTLLGYFDAEMDKRSFERYVRSGFWEHYRIGKQFRMSRRQVLESAMYALNVKRITVTF